MTDVQNLIEANISALKQGSELLGGLKPAQYNLAYRPAFESTIGTHFRHVLEHYRCFINQLQGRMICYDSRERDCELETSLQCAQQEFSAICQQFEAIDFAAYQGELWIEDQQLGESVATSIERELLFLQAHAVHHFAMIAAMMRAFGLRPEVDFGVAVATRLYRRSLAKLANQG
ncbi:MAG: hypothetical protein KJP04_08625 [Arenicella sp.]|nr:hypothetical protein [Arenicella sp.]